MFHSCGKHYPFSLQKRGYNQKADRHHLEPLKLWDSVDQITGDTIYTVEPMTFNSAYFPETKPRPLC